MNKSALLIVDVDSNLLDLNYTKYLIQSQESQIMQYFHGTCQQFINSSDLNKLFESLPIHFRAVRKGEDLTGKLCFNRVGKFGCEVHE